MEQGNLAAARMASYGFLLLAAGLPLHALVDRRACMTARERIVLAAIAAGAMATSLWWTLASIAAMAALPIGDLDRETVAVVLGATPLGTLLTVRAAALVAFLVLLLRSPKPSLLTLAGLPAIATAAWAGHASAGEGAAGTLLKLGDILHLGAASLWLGALCGFLEAVSRRETAPEAIRSLSRFARAGTLIVATLALTGIVDAWLISAGQLPAGPWPVLIATKLALFFTMLGFAARNRWQLVPEFEEARPGARRRLALSLTLETTCAIAIVAIVGFAGLLDPHGG